MDLKDLEKAYKAKQESAFREEAEMHKEALVKKEVIFMDLQKSILGQKNCLKYVHTKKFNRISFHSGYLSFKWR